MGKIKREQEIPLSLFYLKYFMYLFISIICIIVGFLLVFEWMVKNNMIYRADFAQEQAKEASKQISKADTIREEMIPDVCQYIVFDMDGNMKSGNLKKTRRNDAWKAVQTNTTYFRGNYYKIIQREGEICVLQYRIIPQYQSPTLRKYLLSPQNFIIVNLIIFILISVICIAHCFGRALRKKLNPLISAAEKIRNQELDFFVDKSDIREISAVLNSMDKMRIALKESLKQQWQAEQSRREQISALAHDLKTPLTLIRGNAELLYDTEPTDEQKECIEYIEDSSLRMQNYIYTLIEITKSQNSIQFQKQKVYLETFLQKIKNQLKGLCAVKQIRLQWDCIFKTQVIFIDEVLFIRALSNVFSNSVEYTPSGGRILFELRESDGNMIFTITDSGSGFSKEAMKYAKEQFYMEEKSRKHRKHFGIGLYVADSIIKQHGGSMILENSKEICGAKVVIKIPIQ